uniref:Uncharacterized protein n=1 Tax=Anguilla anguilla TaxID=7936 RepID=A0A0E9S6M2_ANGAN
MKCYIIKLLLLLLFIIINSLLERKQS